MPNEYFVLVSKARVWPARPCKMSWQGMWGEWEVVAGDVAERTWQRTWQGTQNSKYRTNCVYDAGYNVSLSTLDVPNTAK